jgi:hypothetical protein
MSKTAMDFKNNTSWYKAVNTIKSSPPKKLSGPVPQKLKSLPAPASCHTGPPERQHTMQYTIRRRINCALRGITRCICTIPKKQTPTTTTHQKDGLGKVCCQIT